MLNNLITMMNNTNSTLTKEVIDILVDMIDTDEEVIATLEDIVTYGCINGTVPALIYNSDCKEFFNRHTEEIFEIYNDNFADEIGYGYKLEVNALVFMAFEFITDRLLGILSEEY